VEKKQEAHTTEQHCSGPTDRQGDAVAFPVVGIGASAGGLEALRLLFKEMPTDIGAAFVVVQHLDPTHESLMADLLGKCTDLPVVQVSDGMRVTCNRVHVIPPNTSLTIGGGALSLSAPTARRGARMPIDQFFSSLADDQQERAIAIVLSGTGTDGTSGVGMIKARGGMLMAQEPGAARFDGMPRSAVSTGHVDYVLPVEEMPKVLAHYLRHLDSRNQSRALEKKDDDYVENILALIRARLDYDFGCYKLGTLRRRIRRRMGLAHLAQLADYHERLRADHQELQALVRDLLIGVTAFFREAEAWEALGQSIMPELIARHRNDEPIRIWVPGCATGEEAYGVAMVALDAMEAAGRTNALIVFASDLDKTSLDVGRKGVYPASVVAPISPERLARYFTREGERFQVKKSLRERVIFAAQDLVADPPFSSIDLICCRNVLIYLEPECQERLMVLFHFALSPGGFLFLGNSETTGQQQGLFRPEIKKWRVYRRVESATARHPNFLQRGGRSGYAVGTTRATGPRQRPRGYGPLTQKALLQHFSPAAVLVNRDGRVLYYHGSVRDYLGPMAGDPSEDLLGLAPEGLRGKLRGLLREAAAEGRAASASDAHVRRGEQWYSVKVTVTPVRDEDQQGHLLLVTLEDDGKPLACDDAVAIDHDRRQDASFGMLEDELRSTREELRDTIEQMETSNEELKASSEEVMSMNEELQSTNEELETSKEELQSLNEELTTLNSQLEDKVHELEDTNNDLGNLLVSTDIATVFLDRRLHIRRYTPAATRLFRLIPSDVGRAMADITFGFDDSDLLDDARRVLAGIAVQQQEVQTKDHRVYLRRLLPYHTEDEPLNGVVVTFTEITERKEAELALAESERTLRRVTDAMPALISYIDATGTYRFVNAAYQRWFGHDANDVVGRKVLDIDGAEAFEVIRPRLDQALAGDVVEYDAWLDYAHAGKRYVHAEYTPDRRRNGEIAGVYGLVSDITERRRSEEAIARLDHENRSRLAEMQALFDAAPIGIFVARDVKCRDMVMNSAGARMMRLSEDVNPSLTGPDASALPFRVYRDGREVRPDELPIQVAARRGERIDAFEAQVHFDDGEVKTLLLGAGPLHDDAGDVCGGVGTFADITALRASEARYREALERLKLHLDNTPVAALEWNVDRRILRWSPAAERVFGWGEAEALGQTLDALGFVHPGDQAGVGDLMSALLNGDAQYNRNLNRNLCKDGSVIWCEWYNSVLRDGNGALISVLSLAMDVSDRQRLESDLRAHAERLSDADRRKDEFLSMLGHELRNPLAPVRNALAVLDLDGDNSRRVDWAFDLIKRQTAHLERLVDDLLDTARITRGAIQLQSEPLDLCAVLRESVESTERLIEERKHDLTIDLPDGPVVIHGDVTRLVQVITNLINNAAKYTEPHGSIRLSLDQAGGAARITITDNGRGIAPEDLAHIFEIFGQGRRSLGRADGGLGLGLPLVRKLVELHGGSAAAESSGEGQGSQFVVCLPLSAGELDPRDGNEHDRPMMPKVPGATKSRRIVLVDDNPDVLESLTLFLQALGHEVWGLPAGEPVVELVQRLQPDAVILDIGLPDIDGIEVARRLGALPWRSSMKVVALSGFSEKAADSGLFDAYMLKGSDVGVLVQVLE